MCWNFHVIHQVSGNELESGMSVVFQQDYTLPHLIFGGGEKSVRQKSNFFQERDI
jgi:hypothetical protein